MAHSEQINEIAAALAKAQALIKGAEKDRLNPHFKSQYATLDSVWKACREPLTANGLSVVQTIETGEHGPGMESILLHSSGQWISSTLAIRGDLDNVQSSGACSPTYAATRCRPSSVSPPRTTMTATRRRLARCTRSARLSLAPSSVRRLGPSLRRRSGPPGSLT